ncbi:hypothetical protein F1880_006130 [Penicillium rolfsii]|nr:hypothetical protein F1880_006130 [Penicillium rolfsii]
MPNPTSIHIIGLGSIGSFLAHSLRALPNPPAVKLLIHRKNLYDEFASKDWTLGLRVNEDGPLQEQKGFGTELLGQSTSEPIQNLIVAVKASATVSALQPIQHRLGPQSTICLFQNGMGQIEDLNTRVFTEEARRPTYMFGIMRHGVYLRSSTEAILSGLNGRAAIGVVDDEKDTNKIPRQANPQFLLDTLLRSPILRCEELAWKDLLQSQLFKLAANCVLNPLTAILDVRNGAIKENPDLKPLIQRLLQEISLVFRSLPELKDLSSDDRFSVSSLDALVMDTIEKTAGNSSSMREDVRKGRATEIEFINGWILRRARELGIECDANAALMQLVLAKSRLTMKTQRTRFRVKPTESNRVPCYRPQQWGIAGHSAVAFPSYRAPSTPYEDAKLYPLDITPTAVKSPNAPTPPPFLSQAIVMGDYVFCSGQIGSHPETGALVQGSIQDRTRQIMSNLRAVLESAGTSLDNVVKCNIFLTNMSDFGAVNEVYTTFFSTPMPVRSSALSR